MMTYQPTQAKTPSKPFFVLSAIDTNLVTSRVNATTGFKRHAGNGTGSDLAPGGAL